MQDYQKMLEIVCACDVKNYLLGEEWGLLIFFGETKRNLFKSNGRSRKRNGSLLYEIETDIPCECE